MHHVNESPQKDRSTGMYVRGVGLLRACAHQCVTLSDADASVQQLTTRKECKLEDLCNITDGNLRLTSD